MSYVNKDEAVGTYIGTPVSPEFIVEGEVIDKGEKGKANLEYNISGSRGRGRVTVYAYKEASEWKLFEVIVNIEDPKERIHVYSPKWTPKHNEKLLNNN